MSVQRLCGALMFLALAARAGAAPLNVVCAPERPMIARGEQVSVTALTDAPAGTRLEFRWSSDGGTILPGASPGVVSWAPGAQALGVFSVRARVAAAGESADCSTEIAVTDALTRGPARTLLSTRALLGRDAQETVGYGLYSYILFAARPTPEQREAYEAILTAALATMGDTDALEARFPAIYGRPRLNITYVPIAHALPDDFDQRSEQAAWIRNNYDYDRAFAYLARLRGVPGAANGVQGGTVWIVSCLHPLSGDADPGPVIPLNLTPVPPRLIPAVMRIYAEQATQPRDYNPYAVPRLMLDLRIAISQLANGLQTVTAAFSLLEGR